MKVRPLLSGLLAGVMMTALMALLALHGNNSGWEMDAYEHGYGVYYRYANENTIRWAWTDDYFRIWREHEARPAVTPLPKEKGSPLGQRTLQLQRLGSQLGQRTLHQKRTLQGERL